MRTKVALVAAGAAAVLGGGMVPGSAGAQSGEATITVDAVHPDGEESAHFIVTVSEDGEPVTGATVTATPTSPTGTEGPAVELTESGETYQGPIEMVTDGTWTIVFESTDPDATLEHTQEMPLGAAPEDDDTDDTDDTDATAADDEDDDGISNPGVLVFGVVFLLAVVGIVIWGMRGRRADGDGRSHDITDSGAESRDDDRDDVGGDTDHVDDSHGDSGDSSDSGGGGDSGSSD